MAELKNRFLYVSAETWGKITDKSIYNNSIVFVKNGNDGVAIYTQGATFGTLDEAEVKAIVEAYGYATTGELSTAVSELTAAIATAKSEAIADAKDYTDQEIKKVSDAIANKNVTAEGDAYVNATAANNKVTVTATDSTKASLALADSALQKADITTGTENGTIAVEGTDVAVKGLGSAAYTDATAYDAAGAASTVKTELLGGAAEGTTLKSLSDAIAGVSADAKTYSIAKVESGLGENVKEAFKLVDEDGTQAGETINIYKDSSLKSVAMGTGEDDQKLVFTYILADGKEDIVKVDVSKFLAESEFGDGLQVIDSVVSVKRDSTTEEYLIVSANGVKVSGIDAIKGVADTAVQSAEGDDYVTVTKEGTKLTFTTTTKEVATATADTDGLATAFDVKTYVDNAVKTGTDGLTSELSADSQYFTKVVITNGKLDATASTKANISEAVLNGYSATSTQQYVGIAATDTINGAFNKVESAWDWAEITA